MKRSNSCCFLVSIVTPENRWNKSGTNTICSIYVLQGF